MKETAISQVNAAPALLRGRKLSPCRILVVDQNSDLRLLYIDALTSPVCQVDVAEDGATAWDALQARRYHLLLTENDTPNLTGDELIKKLRSARMVLPVVMAAERLPMHELVENLPLPFAATLWKPFALETLRDTVQSLLRSTVPLLTHPSRRRRRPILQRTTHICPSPSYENAS
jgi:DNA-binding response OmpR family regulator